MTKYCSSEAAVFDIFTGKQINAATKDKKQRKVKQKAQVYLSPDYKKSASTTYVRGYWGYVLTRRFALFPVLTEDMGYVWLAHYYTFITNTGYDKHSYNWEFWGRAVTPSKMTEIKARAFEQIDSGMRNYSGKR